MIFPYRNFCSTGRPDIVCRNLDEFSARVHYSISYVGSKGSKNDLYEASKHSFGIKQDWGDAILDGLRSKPIGAARDQSCWVQSSTESKHTIAPFQNKTNPNRVSFRFCLISNEEGVVRMALKRARL